MTLEGSLEDFEQNQEEDRIVEAVEIARDERFKVMALAFVEAVRAFAESCDAGERETFFRVRVASHLLVEEAVRELES